MALQTIHKGWLVDVTHQPSPHFNNRPANMEINLLVIHNISLPPGQFGGDYITDLFLGRLDKNAHPYFEDIAALRVSAHCLIRRDGSVIQYVSFDDMAWHAGVSCYQGQEKCNDFSIGIELEGTDDIAYTKKQYQQLANISQTLLSYYPNIKNNIVGHSDIAPGRKTDPGQSFDWQYYQNLLTLEES